MGRNNATLCISAVDVFKVCMTSLMPDDNLGESSGIRIPLFSRRKLNVEAMFGVFMTQPLSRQSL